MSKPIDQEREALPELKSWTAFADALGLNFYMSDALWQNALSLYEKITSARASVQPAGVAVPMGWKPVPVELTEEMRAAFNHVDQSRYAPNNRQLFKGRHAWSRMLAAAPHPVSGEQKAIQRKYPDWGLVRQSDSAISIVQGSTYVTFREGEDDKRMPWLVEFLSSLLAGRDPVDPAAPDVAGLVAEVERISQDYEFRGPGCDAELAITEMREALVEALAAHRAQQGEQNSEPRPSWLDGGAEAVAMAREDEANAVAGLVEALEEIAGGRSSKSDPYIARQALTAYRYWKGGMPS